MEKKGNVFEIILIGISYKELSRSCIDIYHENIDAIEELFQCKKKDYHTIVTTYSMENNEFGSTINKILFYENLLFIKNEVYHLNKKESYSSINYLDKIDDYLIYSDYYIKYISNTSIKASIGKLSIIEMARCDKNMGLMLESFGYKKQKSTSQKGYLFKYKADSIIAIVKEFECNNKKIYHIIEIHGFCKESKKDYLSKKIEEIKNNLSELFYFSEIPGIK